MNNQFLKFVRDDQSDVLIVPSEIAAIEEVYDDEGVHCTIYLKGGNKIKVDDEERQIEAALLQFYGSLSTVNVNS